MPPPWLEVGSTLSLFSAFGSGTNGAYVRFVADGAERPESPLERVRRQMYLGDNRFLEEMSGHAEQRKSDHEIPAAHRTPTVVEIDEIRQLVSKEWGVPAEELAGHEAGDAKLAAIYLSRRLCGKSAREVGDAFGIKRGRVGNIMAEIQKKRRSYLRMRADKLVSDLKTSGDPT